MSACFSTIQAFSNSSAASWISFQTGGGAINIIVLNGTLLAPGMPGYNASYSAFVFGNTTINGSSTGTLINVSATSITSTVLCVGGGGAGGQGDTTFNGGGGGGAQVVTDAVYVIPAAGNTVVSVASGSYLNGSSTIDLTTSLATTINNGTTIVTAYSGRAGGFNNGVYTGSNNPLISGAGGGGASSSSIAYSGSSAGVLKNATNINFGTSSYGLTSIYSGGISPSLCQSSYSYNGQIILQLEYYESTYISTNYGLSYVYSGEISTGMLTTQATIKVSPNGQYIYLIQNISSVYYLYVSTNYGISSYVSTSLAGAPVGANYELATSYYGQYIIVCVYNNTNVYYSTNYGVSFSSTTINGLTNTGITALTNTILYVPNTTATFMVAVTNTVTYFCDITTMIFSSIPALSNASSQMVCNTTKQYIAYLGNTYNPVNLYLSTNSGQTFTLNTTLASAYFGYVNISMSPSGQYIAAATYSLGSSTANYLIISTDYGTTWTTVNNNVSVFGLTSVFITYDGLSVFYGGADNSSHFFSYNIPTSAGITAGYAGASGTIGTGVVVSSGAFTGGIYGAGVNMMCTYNGKYIFIGRSDGGILCSSTYGATWIINKTTSGTVNDALCVSYAGDYIYWSDNSVETYLYVSNVSTFFQSTVALASCTTAAYSGNGSNTALYACNNSGKYMIQVNNSIKYSSTYGASFNNYTNISTTAITNNSYPYVYYVPNSTATFLIPNNKSQNGSTIVYVVDFSPSTPTYYTLMTVTNLHSICCDQTVKYITYITGANPYDINYSTNSGLTSALISGVSQGIFIYINALAMSATGQFQVYGTSFTGGTNYFYISTNYGTTWVSQYSNDGFGFLGICASGTGSSLYGSFDGSSVINSEIVNVPYGSLLVALCGTGGSGGGIGDSNGNGTIFAISSQYYGGGGGGGGINTTPPVYGGGGAGGYSVGGSYSGTPGSGGGGGGGSITNGYTAGAWGGSGQVAVYLSNTSYPITYTSVNPPNQTYISNIAQGGPAATGTSVLAFLAGLPSFTSANPFTYTASGYTGASLYRNGNYITSGSSYNISGSNYVSYLLSTSVSTVYSPNSAYTTYTGAITTYDQVSAAWIAGEWFQAQIPYSIILTNYLFYTASNASPSAISLLGSNDGTLFYTLNTQIGLSAATAISVSSINTGTVNNAYFSIYRWVVTTGRSTSIATSIYNIQLTN